MVDSGITVGSFSTSHIVIGEITVVEIDALDTSFSVPAANASRFRRKSSKKDSVSVVLSEISVAVVVDVAVVVADVMDFELKIYYSAFIDSQNYRSKFEKCVFFIVQWLAVKRPASF